MKAERRRIDGILLLDKPLHLSSNAALQRVKRAFRADKAGHTGSLDPLATGVLPVCLGSATRVSGFLLDADKSYRARVRLGIGTSTGDAEGEAVAHSDWSAARRDAFEASLAGLLGAQQQVPPMYSALKRDGQPLYRLARQGVEVEREARAIQIHDLAITAFELPEFEFTVRCSKGTYVRTLAQDWAQRCGQQAHLVALRRIRLGRLDELDTIGLAELEAMTDLGAKDARLLDAGVAVADWPRVTVDRGQAGLLAQGRCLALGAAAPAQAGRAAVFGESGRLLALAELGAGGSLRPRSWLGEATAGPGSL